MDQFIFSITGLFFLMDGLVIYHSMPIKRVCYKMYISLFVFRAECNDGFYGQDCSFKCTSTCASCNNVNGVCDSGCLPGWKGIDCRKRKIRTTHSFLPISRFVICLWSLSLLWFVYYLLSTMLSSSSYSLRKRNFWDRLQSDMWKVSGKRRV